MNTPNKLTVFRIILVPFFMIFAMSENNVFRIIALLIFILASITDYYDGMLARKNNQITTFGKFMDPLADKMLTTAAFLVFMYLGLISPWVLLIILFREFAVSGIRLSAVSTGTVIAANMWGKAKTVSQMFAIMLSMVLLIIHVFPDGTTYIIINVMVWISTILTIISGLDYILKNKSTLVLK